ncbi:MAG TPA: hypothetical protein VNR18_11935 [Hyphomicrobiales bacterium]|nr:hypothetical protein [Hyphomicrobiales bacterium]
MLRLSFFLACLCACSSLAGAAEDPYSRLAGTYVGEVYNGADLDPVITEFILQPTGRMTGSYSVDEEDGAFSGTLSNILFEDERTISLEWTDKFGEGFAIMEFSRDFSSFTGEWTGKDGTNPLPWTGEKQ